MGPKLIAIKCPPLLRTTEQDIQTNTYAITELLSQLCNEKIDKVETIPMESPMLSVLAKDAYKHSPVLRACLADSFIKVFEKFIAQSKKESPKKEKFKIFKENFEWDLIQDEFATKVGK